MPEWIWSLIDFLNIFISLGLLFGDAGILLAIFILRSIDAMLICIDFFLDMAARLFCFFE